MVSQPEDLILSPRLKKHVIANWLISTHTTNISNRGHMIIWRFNLDMLKILNESCVTVDNGLPSPSCIT